MNTLTRLALRSCLAMAALSLFSVTTTLAQNWLMDAQPDLALKTSVDCSQTVHFVSDSQGGAYIVGNPAYVGSVRVERLRRLTTTGLIDSGFSYTAPVGWTISHVLGLPEGCLVTLANGTSEFTTLQLSTSGSLLKRYDLLANRSVTVGTLMKNGHAMVYALESTVGAMGGKLFAIDPHTQSIQQLDCPLLDPMNTVNYLVPRNEGGVFVSGFFAHGAAHIGAVAENGTYLPDFHSVGIPTDITPIWGIAPLSDGSLVGIGHHARVDGNGPILTLYRFDPSGAVLSDYASALSGDVTHVNALPQDRMLVEIRNQPGTNRPALTVDTNTDDSRFTHTTVLIISKDGAILRDLGQELGRGYDCTLAGLLGDGSFVIRGGKAIQQLEETWGLSYLASRIPDPSLILVGASGALTPLSQRLLETRDGSISQYLPDGAGGLYLQGDFERIQGVDRPGLAHLLSSGQLDTTFSPSTTGGRYSGQIHFRDVDGTMLFLRDEYSETTDANAFFSKRKVLRRLSAQGVYDSTFNGLERSETNRLKILAHGGKGYLASFFSPDNSSSSNLRLQWFSNAGTPVLTPVSPAFSGVSRRGNLSTEQNGWALENTLAYCLALPNGRMAVYAGPSSYPDYYYTTRSGFTGVNGQQVPGFFFLDENLVPDQTANARLNGIQGIDWAALNVDGSIQMNALDATSGRMESASFALLPDGSRDPHHPSFVMPRITYAAKFWQFVDLDGKAVAASNFIQESDHSLWSLSPFAHYHRNADPESISLYPFEQTVASGSRACFTLYSDNPYSATYQWFLNGVALQGETNNYLSLASITSANAGEYRVEITQPGATEPLVRLAHLEVAPPDTGLLNISARATVSPASPLILGLSLQAKSAHKLLARTIGRGLADYGAPAPLLGDSKLSLNGPGGLLQSKSGGLTDADIVALSTQVGAFSIKSSTDSQGSALARSLGTGVYSLVAEPTDGSTGTALSEVYLTDASDLPTGSLRNLSARGHVDAGGNPFIVGLVVKGTTPLRILLRAVGPELSGFGIKDALADPVMEFHSDYSTIPFTLTNDNWSGDTAIAAAFKQVGAFDLPATSKDSALILTLDPGIYTVLIRDAKSIAGTVLVEAYVLN